MCYGRWAAKGLMGFSQFHVEQMVDAFNIALDAVAGDGLAAGGADVAYLAKLFALADIGDVDLYRWNADGFHGVEQGDGGVGVGGGVDDDAVCGAVAGLNLVDEVAFVVALVDLYVDATCFGVVIDEGAEVGVGGAAVDIRLADAEHVEVWPVNDA